MFVIFVFSNHLFIKKVEIWTIEMNCSKKLMMSFRN